MKSNNTQQPVQHIAWFYVVLRNDIVYLKLGFFKNITFRRSATVQYWQDVMFNKKKFSTIKKLLFIIGLIISATPFSQKKI